MGMRRRQGFTFMEVIVVSGLMAFLTMLLAAASAGIGRPAADVIRRSQSLQEMNIAVSALARDLGGSLANPNGRLGAKNVGQLAGCRCDPDSQYPANSVLSLTFNNGTNPDSVVRYYATPDAAASAKLGQNSYWLIREDTNAHATFTVARNLSSFQATRLTDSTIEINLTFLHRMHQPQGQSQYLTRSCSMIAKTP
jgi:type II secretory pathway component PulJ